MDEMTPHRKARLRALIEGKPWLGNQNAFAQFTGLSKGRITQLLDPGESFGERAGMNLVSRMPSLNLPDRYFDLPSQSAGIVDLSEQHALPNLNRTLPRERESQSVISPELDESNPIPTDMPFSNRNLTQTFRLLGNIIGALPASKRAVLAEHLTGLVEDPEAANYIAKQAVKRLGVPDAITGNAQLNRWLAGDLDVSVETRPAPLGVK